MRLENRNRRGISEIIGGLLMILVTISIGVAVVAGSSSELNAVTSNFLNLISSNSKTISDNMVIEQVQFNSGLTTADLFVRDVGTTSLRISSVYIVLATNNTLVDRVTFSPTLLFQPGSFMELAITFSFTGGSPYTFIVVARDSTQVSTNAVA